MLACWNLCKQLLVCSILSLLEVGPPTVTDSLDEFERALEDLAIHGGGDCPEAALGGIKMGLEVSWPQSYIFVFTDAPPKDTHLEDDIIDLLQTTNSRVSGMWVSYCVDADTVVCCQIVFVLTNGCDDTDSRFGIYRKIATIGKGEVFQLKNENLIPPIINFIRVSISDRQVTLLYQPELTFSTSLRFHVDTCIQELLVTATSLRSSAFTSSPEIRSLYVHNPLGVQFVNKVLDLRIAKVIKIDSPIAGLWYVTVHASGLYGVQVRGRSFCDFEPNFAYSSAPKSFYTRPAIGNGYFSTVVDSTYSIMHVFSGLFCLFR